LFKINVTLRYTNSVSSAGSSNNKIKINLAKTKEIVFKRPNHRLSVHLAPVANIEQVRAAKLLGVVLCDSLLFDEHVHAVLKTILTRMLFVC